MKTQKQSYQELELIPGLGSSPLNSITMRLSKVWQAIEMILSRSPRPCVAAALPPEQHISHLKNCLELDSLTLPKTSSWSDFWKHIFHGNWGIYGKSFPRINYVDEDGWQYWYGHNPVTKETVFLESEDAAKSWLESYQLKLF